MSFSSLCSKGGKEHSRLRAEESKAGTRRNPVNLRIVQLIEHFARWLIEFRSFLFLPVFCREYT